MKAICVCPPKKPCTIMREQKLISNRKARLRLIKKSAIVLVKLASSQTYAYYLQYVTGMYYMMALE